MGEDAHRLVTDDEPNHVGLAVGLVIGLPMIGFGVVEILRHTDATPLPNYLEFFVGGDIAHDALIAPIAALVAYCVLRRVPAVGRGPLRAFLFGAVIVIAIAWPGIRMYGRMRAPDNATVQPLDYATATLTVVGVVGVIAIMWFIGALLAARRPRDRSQGFPSSDP
jgi:hypothetical protein